MYNGLDKIIYNSSTTVKKIGESTFSDLSSIGRLVDVVVAPDNS